MSTTFGDDVSIDATATITSTATAAFAVGSGSGNGFQVDESASAATGVKVTPQMAGSGVGISAISSGTSEALAVDAKGAGSVAIAGTSTGDVLLAGGGGKVGIGVSSPSAKLHVAASANGELELVELQNDAAYNTSPAVSLEFNVNSDSSMRNAVTLRASMPNSTDATRQTMLEILTSQAGSIAAAVTIRGSNLGVGTSSQFGNCRQVIEIANGTAPDTNPSGGGILYVSGGNLFYLGPSGSAVQLN